MLAADEGATAGGPLHEGPSGETPEEKIGVQPARARFAGVQPGDRAMMQEALRLAQRAAESGEVPVGAVVARKGVVIGRGHNRRETWADPTAHAEILAIREAARALGGWRLTGCTLYVTLEPCAMCAGAIVLARLDRVVYGAADPKAGAVGSLMNLVQDERLNHRAEVVAGVEAEACAELLRTFFRSRRR